MFKCLGTLDQSSSNYGYVSFGTENVRKYDMKMDVYYEIPAQIPLISNNTYYLCVTDINYSVIAIYFT